MKQRVLVINLMHLNADIIKKQVVEVNKDCFLEVVIFIIEQILQKVYSGLNSHYDYLMVNVFVNLKQILVNYNVVIVVVVVGEDSIAYSKI